MLVEHSPTFTQPTPRKASFTSARHRRRPRTRRDAILRGLASSRHDGLLHRASHRTGTCGPRIRLFGLVHQNASSSWADTCGVLSSSHRVFSDTSRPVNQENRIGPRHARTVGLVPDTPAAIRGAGGSPAARPHCQKMPEKEAGSLLLTHDDRSQPTADMGVEYTQSLDTLFRAKPGSAPSTR